MFYRISKDLKHTNTLKMYRILNSAEIDLFVPDAFSAKYSCNSVDLCYL